MVRRRQWVFAWLVMAVVPACAQSPVPGVAITIPEPTSPLGDKCQVVQGKPVSTRPVRLRQTFLEDFSAFDPGAAGRNGWQTHFPFSKPAEWQSRTLPGNREQQLYVDERYRPQGVGLTPRNPFSVTNGVLKITARREAQPIGPFKDLQGREHSFPYTSGLLTTFRKFSQRYGYFELRAKLPLDRALWSGLWMLRADVVQWPPEIDVIEINNRQPERPARQGINALHSKVDGQSKSDGCYIDVAGADTDFHTYGVLWTADRITYYRDRVPVTVTKPPADMHSPMYLLLQLAVGPNVNADTPAIAELEADWIAAYAVE
jgi:beta-glucanase (GH16 family)